MRPESSLPQALIGAPSTRDWSAFSAWAEAEGWRVPSRELALYRRELVDSAFVLHDSNDVPLGMVTVCHQPGGNRNGSRHGRSRGFHAGRFCPWTV